MVIELTFNRAEKMERTVRVAVGYMSMEEMMEKEPGLLKAMVENARKEPEYLKKLKYETNEILFNNTNQY